MYRPLRREGAVDERHLMRASRVVVMLVALVAFVLALWSPSELVNLLIFGYDGISQFFPGIVLGLFVSRVTSFPSRPACWPAKRWSCRCSGAATIRSIGMNAGFVGLAANALVTLVMTAIVDRTPTHQPTANT